MVTIGDVVRFVKQNSMAVLATVSESGLPEAALIQFACTNAFELVFDTVPAARKTENLRRMRRAAVVIGFTDEITVQLEGEAVELSGDSLLVYRPAYLRAFSAARSHSASPGLIYFKIEPRWIRYSDLSGHEPVIREFSFPGYPSREPAGEML